tara:strand:- start:215 stop:646 length:432 start_codon:yes stop_codon:yes gene_type:complete
MKTFKKLVNPVHPVAPVSSQTSPHASHSPARQEDELVAKKDRQALIGLFEGTNPGYPGYADALINIYNKDEEFKQGVVDLIRKGGNRPDLTIKNMNMGKYIVYIRKHFLKEGWPSVCLPEGWIWKKDDSTDLVEIVKKPPVES